jgi:hypothetical protein
MKNLLERVRFRLAAGSYANEAAVSHGVVTPILNALGWDSSDPDQLVPEFSIGRGRVDFALLGLGRRPSVFIEVKEWDAPSMATDSSLNTLFTKACLCAY